MAEQKKKGLNTNSNTYIIVYSAIMVIIVAFLLAFIYKALKPMQDVNVALDKKKQILAALNIRDLDNDEVAKRYAEVVLADHIIDESGQIITNGTRGGESAAFTLNSADYKEGRLALFVCKIDGKYKYVVTIYGNGLWGPIWGYISINDDHETIYGAYFNHDSETAGLGAEIKDSREWQEQFAGKSIYGHDTGDILSNVALSVEKTVTNERYEVEGVTGATLTCNGVTQMIEEGFEAYRGFAMRPYKWEEDEEYEFE